MGNTANTPSKLAEKRIRDSDIKSLTLGLNSMGLTTIPESVGQFTNLTWLKADSNQLTTIPESIGQLTKLTALNLSSNQLTTIPESIRKLKKLSQLNLGNNQFTTIPEWIGQLTTLMRLDLEDNQLTTIPESITQLINLLVLKISGNPQLKYPNDIINSMDAKTILKYIKESAMQIVKSVVNDPLASAASPSIQTQIIEATAPPLDFQIEVVQQVKEPPPSYNDVLNENKNEG